MAVTMKNFWYVVFYSLTINYTSVRRNSFIAFHHLLFYILFYEWHELDWLQF
jgi:hypothetical protein